MKVTLLMAMTVDGKIARTADHFPDWTGREDKRLFARISRQAGVVIMGSRTFDTFATPLPGRKNVVMTRNPDRVSSRADLIYTDSPPEAVLDRLRADGHTHAILAGGATINTVFARRALIDEVIVTISPKIFGEGISLFAGPLDMNLELADVQRIDRNLVCLNYRVVR